MRAMARLVAMAVAAVLLLCSVDLATGASYLVIDPQLMLESFEIVKDTYVGPASAQHR